MADGEFEIVHCATLLLPATPVAPGFMSRRFLLEGADSSPREAVEYVLELPPLEVRENGLNGSSVTLVCIVSSLSPTVAQLGSNLERQLQDTWPCFPFSQASFK